MLQQPVMPLAAKSVSACVCVYIYSLKCDSQVVWKESKTRHCEQDVGQGIQTSEVAFCLNNQTNNIYTIMRAALLTFSQAARK